MGQVAEHELQDEVASDAATKPPATASEGLATAQAGGDVVQTAQLLREHKGDKSALIRDLHTRRGNAFVQAVLDELQKQSAPGSAPQLVGGVNGPAMAMGRTDLSFMDRMKLEDAVASAGKSLDGADAMGPTGVEATAGMHALLKLPAHLQGQAIARLTDEQFEHLLGELPEGNREELEHLVKNTTHPMRKMQLWSVYHKAHVMADANRDPAGTNRESKRRHAAKVKAAKATAAEVDEETMFLAQQAGVSGKSFTVEDVDKLIARKDTEHAMEMKYNVNITNEGGARADGTHIHWSKEELQAFEQTLQRVPESHLAGNAGLKEIRRQDRVFWDAAQTVDVGGMATGNQILVGDSAASTTATGEKREIAPPEVGEDISWMEWLLTHELGHNVGDKFDAAYRKYQKANGWKSHPKSTGKLTDAEKAVLDAKRGNRFDNRATINKGGRMYEIDQDGPGYISCIQGAVPTGDESAAGVIGGGDPWAYARTRGHEQFADHYTRAMHVPEKVYEDLIETPHLAVEHAQTALDSATTEDEKKQAKRQLEIAKRAEKARKKSFELMRNDVFGTASAQREAEARLVARNVDPEELIKFKEAAAKASTPDQIAVLEKRVP